MKRELITQKNPKSPISETFRTLRTNLQFMNSKTDLKSILITSTLPEVGKSWVSANLAITFAQAGKKVILVDADMRKGKLAELFQITQVPGLSNFLSGINEKGENKETELVKIINETEIENLFVIPSGNIPPNPSELLTNERMEDFMEQLKLYFDIIIFDGTPSLIVTDAVIISRMVDTTIIVAEHSRTKKEDLNNIKKAIENVGGKIAGTVINKAPTKESAYKRSYYYGYTNYPQKIKN